MFLSQTKTEKLLQLEYGNWKQPNVEVTNRLKCPNVENTDIKQWMDSIQNKFANINVNMPDIIPGYIFSNSTLRMITIFNVVLFIFTGFCFFKKWCSKNANKHGKHATLKSENKYVSV